MNDFIQIIKEHLKNLPLIIKLTLYSIKSEYAGQKLGIVWAILVPSIQVLIYYIIFGLGLRGDRGLTDGMPFIIYLISGLFPWLFISSSITSGSSSIFRQIDLVTKMKFPSVILITVNILKNVITLALSTVIILFISIYNDMVPIHHYFGFIYFIISSFCLLFSLNLVLSILVILIKDTKHLVQNTVRLFFFLTPIFWSTNVNNKILEYILVLNPFAYLLEVYRLSFVYSDHILTIPLNSHLYYWSIVLLLFILGVMIYSKYKDDLVDYV